jgi:hypothetical protein
MKISSDDGDYKYETELVLDRNGGSRISFVYDEDPSFFEKVFESVDHFGKGSLGRHIEGAITAYDPEKLSFKGRIVNKDGCPQSSVEFSGELSAVNGKPKVQAEGRGVLCLGAVTSAGARTVRLSFTLHECEGSGNTTGADCGMTDAVQIQTYIPGGSEGHKAGASGWMRVGPIPASQYSMAKSYIATSLAGISADDYTTGTPRTYKRTEPSIGIIEIYQVDPCKEDTWGYGGVVSENYAAPKYKVSISGAKAIEYLEKEMQTRKGAP